MVAMFTCSALTGITGSCTVGGGSTFAISCKYNLDKDAAVRAKVDTDRQSGKNTTWCKLELFNHGHTQLLQMIGLTSKTCLIPFTLLHYYNDSN